jgi:hypothetical protein
MHPAETAESGYSLCYGAVSRDEAVITVAFNRLNRPGVSSYTENATDNRQ